MHGKYPRAFYVLSSLTFDAMKRPVMIFCLLLAVVLMSSCATQRKGHGHRKNKGKGKGCDCPGFGQMTPSESHTSFRV